RIGGGFDAAKTRGARVGFAALEKFEPMSAIAESGESYLAGRSSFAKLHHGVGVIHARIEKALAFRVIEEQRQDGSLEIDADPARLPDDHRSQLIGEINLTLVLEMGVGRRNQLPSLCRQ